ncbi:hypothetical protein [Nocardioides sp. B-3]|uniref:hypothetical protein n=1 Tax=Nocardioides sp. B-3 TaxID=2895565 RepID=UPI002152000F|nr:hypothetical protein [Nocardioides sp. B-3]UUZ61901.1 glycerol acyltransferase [Nocardioides sp. B-3]
MSELEDVESLADAVLGAIEEDLAPHPAAGLPDALVTAVSVLQKLGIDWVRRYHRLDLSGELEAPEEPVLFVANHGFGGIFDLNVFAIPATFDALKLDRPVTMLTHQIALDPGSRQAARTHRCSAREHGIGHAGLRRGPARARPPGRRPRAFKGFADRDKIVFSGRSGFAQLAMDAGVSIVPIVTAGAGESLMVLSDGQRLARALRLDKTLRLKALPVSVSLPRGLNVGGVGLLPYLPLPTKLATRVLPAMTAVPEESAADFAARVESEMQQALTALAKARR